MLKNVKLNGKFVQFAGATFVNIGSIIFGICVGWASPIAPILTSEEETPLPSGPLTVDEISLVSSIMALGGMLGAIVFGWISNRLGRKWTLIVGTIPQVIAYVFMATAKNVIFLYASRFLSGVAGGALFVVVPIYVSEISENSIRGMLGTILGIFYNLGIIIASIICTYMPFYSVPFVVLGILSLFIIFLVFPESPQYLLLKCKVAEAEKALKFFRGSSQSNEFKLEFESLKSAINASSSEKHHLSLQDFKPATTKKALLISLVILSGRNFSGIFPLMNYTVSIFKEAETGINPNVSAIIAAVIQLTGAITSAYLTDKFGRRILLLISLLGVAFCYSVLGAYFLLKHLSFNLSEVSWLPIVSLSGCLFLSAGIFNIPLYVMAELLPAKVRSTVTTVLQTSTWPVTFLMVQFYLPLANLVGIHSCMYIFAGWCVFEAIFVYLCLPETKGKSADEIVLALEGKVK
ncbi:hypothetical protein DMENIID0001_060860 [Sergentomyia squamirostris]